jgi:hypothetical protein
MTVLKPRKLVLRILCTLRRRPKVFCIGRNKTGTTSLEKALRDLGYIVGSQATAELLIHDYARRDFRPIVEYCRTAEAFQDIPFSLPYTYQIVDYAFPGSKFILSVRDNDDEWYRSLIRFHQMRLGIDGRITREHLVNDPYRYKGFLWEVNRTIYHSPEDDPYDESVLKEHYLRHNQHVVDYFKFRSDLLVVNLKERRSYQTFCDFLEVDPLYKDFPWLNKSRGASEG